MSLLREYRPKLQIVQNEEGHEKRAVKTTLFDLVTVLQSTIDGDETTQDDQIVATMVQLLGSGQLTWWRAQYQQHKPPVSVGTVSSYPAN